MANLIEKIRELVFPSISFKLSTSLIAFLLVGISIFILGGGVYDIMEKPLFVLPSPGNPIWYYPGMTDQTYNESLISILLFIIGISGGYLSFRSIRSAYRPREAKMFLSVGVTMMIIAFIGCEIMLSFKGL